MCKSCHLAHSLFKKDISIRIFVLFLFAVEEDNKKVLLNSFNLRVYTSFYYMALSHKDWELPNSRI